MAELETCTPMVMVLGSLGRDWQPVMVLLGPQQWWELFIYLSKAKAELLSELSKNYLLFLRKTQMKKIAVLGKGPVIKETLGRKFPAPACAAVVSTATPVRNMSWSAREI